MSKGRFLRRLAEMLGRTADTDFEEEVRFHLEKQVQDLMAGGLDPEAARTEAARMFGNVERIRGDVRRVEGEAKMGSGRMEYGRDAISDLRYSLRQLRRRLGPGAATVAVIALGVGAATTVFTYVERGFLRPLPFPDYDGLFQVREFDRAPISVAYPTFRAWQENAPHLEAVVAFYATNLELQGPAGAPMRIRALRVAGDALEVMGMGPVLGRGFEEAEAGEVEGSAMLSHGFWQDAYGGDASVLGETIRINGEARTVIGVMPPEAELLVDRADASVWLPMMERPWMGPGMHFLRVVARAAPGLSSDEVVERTAALREEPADAGAREHGAVARPLREALVGDARGPTFILAGAVSLLLLITCANLASLSLARAGGRMTEFAVREALGAQGSRVGRMLLTETVSLSLIGGAVGILGARVGLDWLAARASLPLLLQSGGVDVGVVLFGVLVSLVTGVAFGLGAIVTARRAGLADLLRSGGQAGDRKVARRQRRALVGAEAAISVVLLVGTALLAASMVRLLRQDLGFRPEQVVSLELPLSTARYESDESQVLFFEELLERVRRLPGVRSASLGSHIPLSGNDTNGGFRIYGKEFPEDDRPRGKKRLVGADYLETMGIPLLSGRALDERDRAGERQGVMISQAFAEAYWPGEDPLGTEVCFCWGGDTAQVVVGVVGDVRHDGLDQGVEGTVYMSHAQNARAELTLFVRSDGEPLVIVDDVRREVAGLDPLQPIGDVAALDSVLRDSVSDRRILLTVVGFFGLTALILAAFGVYAVTAQSAGRRTNELGLRMALGARGRDVVGLVVRDELVAVAFGLTVGIAMALGLARFLESMLFEISPVDAGPYVAASLLLLGLAVVAALVPAWRAARLDPVQALRAE